jgi:hypothetical protein
MAYELAAKHKTALYLDPFLSLLNSRRITMPKNNRAIAQICALERSTKRSGRDEISHPPHGKDDLANVIAGAAFLAYDRFGLGNYNALGGLEDTSDYQVMRLNSFIEGLAQTGLGYTERRLWSPYGQRW